ncbi:MAG: hypothetical protein JSU66_03835 [Deltaproteobacteria bacterium]|nr:MAG: hypothetical protein JSU66_03835 [Deltaproteobacteria bacterium]
MELRSALRATPDLEVVWVMADNQINDKTLRYIDGLGLREHVHFAVDPDSTAIDRLGIRKDPIDEPIEEGVPHPTTYVLDRAGIVRFIDVREDYHAWLDPSLIAEALAEVP